MPFPSTFLCFALNFERCTLCKIVIHYCTHQQYVLYNFKQTFTVCEHIEQTLHNTPIKNKINVIFYY